MHSTPFVFAGGEKEYTGSIPCANLLKIVKRTDNKNTNSSFEYTNKKLISSLESQSFRELISSSDKALIICDDITRPTPASKILPTVTKYLEHYGIELKDQFILFANGSHRRMTDDEVLSKIGAELYGKIRWANHDWTAKLKQIGTTATGIPVEVNPLLSEYKCIIGIGSVFPHRYCGWSGGGKIIIPGVSGPQTITRTHWLPYYDGSLTLGNPNNTAIDEIMSAAKMAGLSFLIQCICGGEGTLTDIFADTPEKAHKAAVQKALSVTAVPVPPADVVIAQAWPEESDLWQAGKALYAAENAVKKGGSIIVAASLKDGIGPHKIFAELIGADMETLLTYMHRHDSCGLAAAAAYVTRIVKNKASVTFISDSRYSDEIASLTGFKLCSSLQVAIDRLLEYNHSLTFSVLHEAPLILPIPQGRDFSNA